MAYRRPRSAMDNVMNIVMSISAWTLWYTMYVKHAIADLGRLYAILSLIHI